jgi:hypothetical protein
MYQTLIWSAVLRDKPSRLRPPLDPEDVQRLANPLVDGVRRDIEFARNFLRREMLVDETQAIELTRSKPGNPLPDRFLRGMQVLVHAAGHA